MYVALEQPNPPSRCCKVEKETWKNCLSAIPLVGTVFEYFRERSLTKKMVSTPILDKKRSIEVLETKIRNKWCGGINDLICTIGFFLMGGYGVDVIYVITPVTSYISGSCSALSLIYRPFAIRNNLREIAQFQKDSLSDVQL